MDAPNPLTSPETRESVERVPVKNLIARFERLRVDSTATLKQSPSSHAQNSLLLDPATAAQSSASVILEHAEDATIAGSSAVDGAREPEKEAAPEPCLALASTSFDSSETTSETTEPVEPVDSTQLNDQSNYTLPSFSRSGSQLFSEDMGPLATTAVSDPAFRRATSSTLHDRSHKLTSKQRIAWFRKAASIHALRASRERLDSPELHFGLPKSNESNSSLSEPSIAEEPEPQTSAGSLRSLASHSSLPSSPSRLVPAKRTRSGSFAPGFSTPHISLSSDLSEFRMDFDEFSFLPASSVASSVVSRPEAAAPTPLHLRLDDGCVIAHRRRLATPTYASPEKINDFIGLKKVEADNGGVKHGEGRYWVSTAGLPSSPAPASVARVVPRPRSWAVPHEPEDSWIRENERIDGGMTIEANVPSELDMQTSSHSIAFERMIPPIGLDELQVEVEAVEPQFHEVISTMHFEAPIEVPKRNESKRKSFWGKITRLWRRMRGRVGPGTAFA